MPHVEEFGADAVRYWACRGGPGTDTAVDNGVMKVGRRLAIKVLNVIEVRARPRRRRGRRRSPTRSTARCSRSSTASSPTRDRPRSTSYDYSRALDAIETFFWHFCDDYVELVKGRAYTGDASAKAALATALSTLQRLLAPFLAFATEEVWSWWQDGLGAPPAVAARRSALGGDPLVFDVAADALAQVRKAKTEAKRSLRTTVSRPRSPTRRNASPRCVTRSPTCATPAPSPTSCSPRATPTST